MVVGICRYARKKQMLDPYNLANSFQPALQQNPGTSKFLLFLIHVK